MARNIIICSDGTGNTFDAKPSNIHSLLECLALDNHEAQVVAYDQGIGTNARRVDGVMTFRARVPDKNALIVLPPPRRMWFSPTGFTTRFFGLTAGYGLKANVAEIYDVLARLYETTADRVFLFGFSRGAFTVRALAGLVHRCGLPRQDVPDVEQCFEEAWQLYQPMQENAKEVARFRSRPGHRGCEIHFLGIWDTVKSYGGMIPTLLPHLRHNPQVAVVRHALALDERRSWFNATTWGFLDIDTHGAVTRLKPEERPAFERQSIEEIWFRGCHSDVGCGRIAFRWMLTEAVAAGLDANDAGMQAIESADPLPTIEESDRWWWRGIEQIPRLEIDNSGKWPRRQAARGRTGVRHPDELRRHGAVSVHVSVGTDPAIPAPVRVVPTKTAAEVRRARSAAPPSAHR